MQWYDILQVEVEKQIDKAIQSCCEWIFAFKSSNISISKSDGLSTQSEQPLYSQSWSSLHLCFHFHPVLSCLLWRYCIWMVTCWRWWYSCCYGWQFSPLTLAISLCSTIPHTFFPKRKWMRWVNTSRSSARSPHGLNRNTFQMKQLTLAKHHMKQLMAQKRKLPWTISMIQMSWYLSATITSHFSLWISIILVNNKSIHWLLYDIFLYYFPQTWLWPYSTILVVL